MEILPDLDHGARYKKSKSSLQVNDHEREYFSNWPPREQRPSTWTEEEAVRTESLFAFHVLTGQGAKAASRIHSCTTADTSGALSMHCAMSTTF
jgi:hypothetical protein